MSAMSVPVALTSSMAAAPSSPSSPSLASSSAPGRGASESVSDVSAPVPSPRPTLGERLGQWFGRGKSGGQGGAPKDGKDGKGDGKIVAAPLSARAENALRRQLAQCFSARLTDSSANEAAREFMARYGAASAEEQLALLTVVADICASDGEVGGDGKGAVKDTGKDASKDAAKDAAKDARRAASTATGLAGALGSARVRFLKRFNALPDGLPFLVNWRADMLRHRAALPGLAALEDDLGSLFSTWFDVGLLELHPITWDSPASLLEKLMRYEAVHEISSWADLRNRLDSDRRCYAFFHPRMSREPLIFVEVAFVPEMAADVHSLLDEKAPLEDLRRVRWAIFYSISNTQPGLRGVSFGNFLLKRVIDELRLDFPKLRNFATLSPIPGFNDWLRQLSAQALAEALGPKRAKLLAQEPSLATQASGAQMMAWLQASPDRKSGRALQRALGEALAAYYLARETVRGQPRDPVARFHLGNGARVERINWHADLSKKGAKQSCGMMVNYLYEPDELDANLQRLIDGEPALGRAVSRLL
ncbi:malonyl-CoA decarboxylase domain-containing protein [Pandoraea oxalativorans]|uniref:malonyl-CoA decarboxylase domain-containing protein n=1 Tax=Pandoraea oxalativorans TaxID=573737 RepID=UPI001FE210B4|nr:malonyl-CoA decarboxylase family protein [Pandoraea oxalativorans]